MQDELDAAVDFARDSLATLARQIFRYSLAVPHNIDALRGAEKQKERRLFVKHGTRLANQLEHLLAMARDVEALGDLNYEQLEAALAHAREAVESVRQDLVAAN